MTNQTKRVCPVESAGSLDNRIRRWLRSPSKCGVSRPKKGIVKGVKKSIRCTDQRSRKVVGLLP